MRKILLVAAMVLASASAQAAGPRSLSLASADDPASPPQQAAPAPAQQAAETPRYVDRPSPVATTPPAAATTTVPPATTEPAATTTTTTPAPQRTAKASRPRHQRYWTEGRIIGELHRYGIYW